MGKRGWIGLLLIFGGMLAFAARAGYMLVIDSPQPSDVIVVLAGETDKRPRRAFQLLDQGYAHRIILDVPAERKEFGFSELDLAQKYVQGFPEAALVDICPIEGLSTRDESHDAPTSGYAGRGGTQLTVGVKTNRPPTFLLELRQFSLAAN